MKLTYDFSVLCAFIFSVFILVKTNLKLHYHYPESEDTTHFYMLTRELKSLEHYEERSFENLILNTDWRQGRQWIAMHNLPRESQWMEYMGLEEMVKWQNFLRKTKDRKLWSRNMAHRRIEIKLDCFHQKMTNGSSKSGKRNFRWWRFGNRYIIDTSQLWHK